MFSVMKFNYLFKRDYIQSKIFTYGALNQRFFESIMCKKRFRTTEIYIILYIYYKLHFFYVI